MLQPSTTIRGFHGRPKSEDLGTRDESGRVWHRLTEPLFYTTLIGGEHRTIEVPAGFESDLASIPRRLRITWLPRCVLRWCPAWLRWIGRVGIPLWAIFPPTGKYNPAAWLHDWLYSRDGNTSRVVADAIFDEAMKLEGVRWRRPVMSLAVRLFGGGAYHSR